MKLRLRWAGALLLAWATSTPVFADRQTIDFNSGWRFMREEVSGASARSFADANWEAVTLPHTARIEALVAGKNAPQWQGICWYRKSFDLPAAATNRQAILRFEGAMNVAEVWVNGVSAGKFMGGYLPYVLDVSDLVRAGSSNVVAVRLDNRDNPLTGPKPLVELDFNLYGGIYRGATLVLRDRLNITDSLLANKVASGGVFVTFPKVTQNEARIRVQVHVRNAHAVSRQFKTRTTLLQLDGTPVSAPTETIETLSPDIDRDVVHELVVLNPRLWSPAHPNLYLVRTELIADGVIVDSETTRIGIRQLEITADGLRINGEKRFLRGVNRHQEYPYIGNALSDAAQYRDARKIKEAGFDYVRLSHYPQSPAFLDACDELGLAVMNCLMGWQFFNRDPAFAELKLRECREMVRRDRNHPSVILWESCLNESDMPKAFIAQAHAVSHEEYPGDQFHTCGWTKGFDVFIQARQHGGCAKVGNIPCVVSEYGDWEYFAQNAGLEQHKWKDLQPAARNSRQFRRDGEVRLLQQALNFQEAHNDNLKTRAFADGLWVMFDYNRGYAEDIEASGVMDIFRLPKFSYWFYRSQRAPDEIVAGAVVGPVVHIASWWTPDSPADIRVFSNCEEVALYLNGALVERRRADANQFSTHLKRPPFTFALKDFKPGTLRAVGFIHGKEAAQHELRTPGSICELKLRFDLSGRPFAAGGKDAVFCHGELRDASGTIVPTSAEVVFETVGDAELVGLPSISAEAGIATALMQSDRANPKCAVYAVSVIREADGWRALASAGSPNGTKVEPFELRYAIDGQVSSSSPGYAGPIVTSQPVTVGLFVAGELIAQTSSADKAARVSR